MQGNFGYLTLRVEDINLRSLEVNIRSLEVNIRSEEAKTRVSRTLPLSPVTANAIRELISARHRAWKNSTPVFCSSEGTAMTAIKWGDRLEIYSKNLGIHIRPYDLRYPNFNKINPIPLN